MGDQEEEIKPMAEDAVNGLSNGLSNGTSDHREHKEHKSKDREGDKARHRDKDRHKSSHRDKDRTKDKDRHSSSHKSSHKDKDRDKSRDKDRDRHRTKDKDRSEKDKDRSEKDKERSEKDKERSGKDKERSEKDKSRSEKDKSRSEKDKPRSEKDKERSDKDKERSEKDKDKEKSKEDKPRDRERSDKEKRDKDKDRNDKHKERDRDKHRDDKDKRSSTSSSSRKDRHHSSHKSSRKDKHGDREKEDTEKIQIKEEKLDEPEIKHEPIEDVEEEEGKEIKTETEEKMEIVSASESMEDFIEEPQANYVKEEEEEPEDVDIKEEDPDEDPELVIKEEKMEESENDEDDDVPLASRKRVKEEDEDEDDDDKPLIVRKKVKPEKKKRKKLDEDDEDEDFRPSKKKAKKDKNKNKAKKTKEIKKESESPTKGKKKKEEEENVWKWWEEEKREDGKKWTFLEHKGPILADPYQRLPNNVKFYYNGEHMILSELAEETAGFYAKMLEHDYTTKEVFNKNFFKDWKKTMTQKEREKIEDLSKCDFKKIFAYYTMKNEERKNRTKEEKKELKVKNEALIAEYGWCTIDGHKQRIGNFKIEPPGLFRGRGEHPKQGMVKRRTMPEDVIINCSKDSKIPKPPDGHKWKQVRHDCNVTWLACWNENIQGSTKYVMLNAASKLKGEKDWQKYESARRLHKSVDKIRENYRADWRSKEMRIRQRGVALYFIDKLALRAGNEKDEDQADTVGCCSLRYEHLTLHEEKDGKEYVVVFDFLGKDSIRYYNEVPVEKRVFKNLQLFMESKQDGDDIFDRLNTQILNKYLNELLEGLTAKVFRTYNASRTLQEQLEKVTNPDDPLPAQILSYNRANREVAILCNHQRAVPKTFDKSMANLQKKIDDKKDFIDAAEKDLKDLKRAAKHGGSVKDKVNYEKKKKAVERLKEQLGKLEISATDKEENKQIALGTSKLNYLDPRITVAWCKKNNIPIDKVYNKTQRQKFQWAIDMATADFNFMKHDTNAKFSNVTKNSDDEGDEEEEEE